MQLVVAGGSAMPKSVLDIIKEAKQRLDDIELVYKDKEMTEKEVRLAILGVGLKLVNEDESTL